MYIKNEDGGWEKTTLQPRDRCVLRGHTINFLRKGVRLHASHEKGKLPSHTDVGSVAYAVGKIEPWQFGFIARMVADSVGCKALKEPGHNSFRLVAN